MTDSGATPDRRRLGAKVLLLVGVGLAAALLAPSLPHDQSLEFRIQGPAPVARLDGSLTPAGEAEPARGFSLHFERTPPDRIRHTVSLPNGEYLLDVRVALAGANPAPETLFSRRVTLAGEHTIVPLDLRP